MLEAVDAALPVAKEEDAAYQYVVEGDLWYVRPWRFR